ncbi:hypothetical protein FQN54_004337 [Arachnomyces sp. PD_36]|nr:hypothetical protein FQN54_004337 [Arachnomyces sp. PD_36]
MRFSFLQLALFGSNVAASAVARNSAFSFNNETFFLNGEPYQMIGGEIEPQRVPEALWADRLQKARAMGLNTIFSYIWWNEIQPTKDSWEYSGINNVTRFFELAQENDLNIVLRPGPYVCAEHEWGGFPAWLTQVPDMAVRTDNEPFLDASKTYIDRLAAEVAPLSVFNGGPILMVQVENEYGSFGSDHVYTEKLRDIFLEAFDQPLYTTDGSGESYLAGGPIDGVIAEIDGDAATGFPLLRNYMKEHPSSSGPLLNGEFYWSWFDQWSSESPHNGYSDDPAKVEKAIDDIDWILSNNNSINIFMFHGGTNWGFQNGNFNNTGHMTPVTTSYDYGALLDESGRTTTMYDKVRKLLVSKYVDEASLPDVPEMEPLIDIPEIKLQPALSLFDTLPKPTTKTSPVNMEALGQAYGYTLYRHTIKDAIKGALQPGDHARDRVLVYVNDARVGAIDSIYDVPNVVTLNLKANDTLDLLVENLGRVNYGQEIVDQLKGIVGDVTVGGSALSDWESYPLGLETLPDLGNKTAPAPVENDPPLFYSGSFTLDKVGDTYIQLEDWTKGVVWVNDINIGRYWIIGSQQGLYVPNCYLKEGENSIVVLALEPTPDQGPVTGVSERVWANYPDPDR